MRHARSFSFDCLETRMLLTAKAHRVAARAAPVVVRDVLVLDGTLTVDNKAAYVSENENGDITTLTPISGTLSGVGAVHGVWNESEDSMGDYLGPDLLQLHTAQGMFVVAFDDQNPGKSHKTATGAAFNPLPQRVQGGSGAYVNALESGTLVLNTNKARSVVETMTLNSTNK